MVALIFLLMSGGSCAHATLLLQEFFSYSNGPITTVSSGLWTTHSGTAGQLEVIDGRANLSSGDTEDVNVLIPGQPYTAASGISLYVSLTVNFATLPSGNGQYLVHLKGAGTSNFRAKLFAFSAGSGAGQFRLALANDAGSVPSVTNATPLLLNTDYRVFLRYVAASGVATLWVDPDSEGAPSVTAGDATSGANITSLALREDSGIGVANIDDLRIGTSFADVYAITPPSFTQQPAGATVVEGGGVTFSAAATGTAPLAYQWKFNNVPIAGATNTSLTLAGVTTNAAGSYRLSVTNAGGFAESSAATLTVIAPNASGTLTLVHHNVKGNFASDWSTNAAQVQAIARQLRQLTPDIITLNEIPNGLRYEMTNWMAAFFPTYQLAVSPGTDGVLRSGVISRFPIVRTQSWLLDASLTNFGYNGTFVRDLFEAEIAVPGAGETLHVFTTHLKSGSDAASQNQRAAECSVVSNFLVTVFLPTNGGKPFLLTGDLNEDLAIPMSQGQQPIQRLVAPATGLQLTTPVNPFTLARYTHSIQGALDARFDYVLPNGLLVSNVVVSQVFRSDQLTPPPPPLLTNDSVVASDHLPVQMIFNYPDPPLRTSLGLSNQIVTLTWPALIGRRFEVQASTNLTTWTAVATVPVVVTPATWTTPLGGSREFYRVVRLP